MVKKKIVELVVANASGLSHGTAPLLVFTTKHWNGCERFLPFKHFRAEDNEPGFQVRSLVRQHSMYVRKASLADQVKQTRRNRLIKM